MVEPKISLRLLVPGACILSSQECEKSPKENYDKHKMLVKYTKGKGKAERQVKELLIFKTRKSKLITQVINMSEETYNSMLNTPTSEKLHKIVEIQKGGRAVRAWDKLSVNERLKKHFDLIAHDLKAVSYTFEVLDD